MIKSYKVLIWELHECSHFTKASEYWCLRGQKFMAPSLCKAVTIGTRFSLVPHRFKASVQISQNYPKIIRTVPPLESPHPPLFNLWIDTVRVFSLSKVSRLAFIMLHLIGNGKHRNEVVSGVSHCPRSQSETPVHRKAASLNYLRILVIKNHITCKIPRRWSQKERNVWS